MTNATIVQLYGKLIATTLILDSEIKKKLNKRGFLPDSLIAQLAEEHARRYDNGLYIAQTSTGVYKFYTSAEASTATLQKSAVQQWSRTIGKLHDVEKSTRGGARKTEAKPEWQKLGDAFNELSRTEKNAFLKYVGEK